MVRLVPREPQALLGPMVQLAQRVPRERLVRRERLVLLEPRVQQVLPERPVPMER